MADMIVVSDKLKLDKKDLEMIGNVEIYQWSDENIPSLFDNEIIVLDMNTDSDITTLFDEKCEDIKRALLKGGNVIICLTHISTDELVAAYIDISDESISDEPIEPIELIEIKILNANGKNIELLPAYKEIFKNYFEGVTEYHAIIDNISEVIIIDNISEVISKVAYFDGKTLPDLEIEGLKKIAVVRATGDIIACFIDNYKGTLIFLPQNNKNTLDLIKDLKEIGEYYYERNKQKDGDYIPEWLDKYKTKQEKELKKKLIEIKRKITQFKKIGFLLYKGDKDLVDAVKIVLGEFGLNVKKTEKGATIDLNAIDPTTERKFAIEVTGVAGKIKKETKKIAQIWDYIRRMDENDKIVLVANTYKDDDLDKRKSKENFTKNVIDILSSNNVCLITSVNLYYLWNDLIENKRTKNEIIDLIYNTSGELQLD